MQPHCRLLRPVILGLVHRQRRHLSRVSLVFLDFVHARFPASSSPTRVWWTLNVANAGLNAVDNNAPPPSFQPVSKGGAPTKKAAWSSILS
ncbi:unnamed protein product [Protopolystoma xenopodis]|uniref:Uncharacterized protein n=1 Tax=Protopolystoma xenopodis TaxID=117903 RepID=A0A448X7P3_9PLAT|nr:unnamed protein product [Protopolystoma xenopodis]